MIDGKGYSFKANYWAFGVIIYRIMYDKFPFTNLAKDPFDIFKHIIKNNVDFKVASKFSPTLIQFTRQLLYSDPKSRANENGMRNHEIFMEIDWEQFEKRKSVPPFNIEMFGMNKLDRKFYEEEKNYFSNFI
jgi:serine/threonine protein kinase